MSTEQLEYIASDSGASQCEIALWLLKRHVGDWVAMPDIARAMGGFAVHSRVSDLRKAGHMIDHKNERAEGRTHSFYRLVA